MSKDLYTIDAKSLREQIPNDDAIEVFFGNGNLEFYRTKMRGERLLQIEFNESTDLASEEAWIPVEQDKPESGEVVAVICRQNDGGILRLTASLNDGSWIIIGNRPDLRIVEVTHWYYLPSQIPVYRRGDPIS